MNGLGQAVDSKRTGSATRNIGKELNVSEKELSGLLEVIGELHDRLSPISLRPDEKVGFEALSDKPDKACCDVEAAICSINRRISQQAERLKAMITELQV